MRLRGGQRWPTLRAVARKTNGRLWAEHLQGNSRPSAAQVPVARPRQLRRNLVVLGVDPSLRGTGMAVLEVRGGRCRLCHSEVFRLHRSTPETTCLGQLAVRTEELLGAFPVDTAAVEEAIYVQNYQTALTLGAARGAILSSLARGGLSIHAYPPLRVKQALVGFGRASKEQVRRTLGQWVEGADESLTLDESDALALALCHWLTGTPDETPEVSREDA